MLHWNFPHSEYIQKLNVFAHVQYRLYLSFFIWFPCATYHSVCLINLSFPAVRRKSVNTPQTVETVQDLTRENVLKPLQQ